MVSRLSLSMVVKILLFIIILLSSKEGTKTKIGVGYSFVVVTTKSSLLSGRRRRFGETIQRRTVFSHHPITTKNDKKNAVVYERILLRSFSSSVYDHQNVQTTTTTTTTNDMLKYSIERIMGKHLNNNNQTLLEVFNNINDERIMKADKYLVDDIINTIINSTSSSTTNHHNNNDGEIMKDQKKQKQKQKNRVDGVSSSFLDHQPFVTYQDLKQLHLEVQSSPNSDRLQKLFDICQSSGGYLIVKLNEDQSKLVANMWSIMKEFYDIVDNHNNIQEDVELHHQALSRKNEDDDKQTTGYRFVQTYKDTAITTITNYTTTIQPTTIQDTIVASRNRISTSSNIDNNPEVIIEDVFDLFMNISRIVGTMLTAGALMMQDDHDSKVINNTHNFDDISKVIYDLLGDDEETSTTPTSNHRLCQYINDDGEDTAGSSSSSSSSSRDAFQNRNTVSDEPSSFSHNSNNSNHYKEALKSHTDWTITTSIPYSQIPGLQLWNPQLMQWISPEKQHQQQQQQQQIRHGGGAYSNDDHDHTKYVVVIVGKWLELLTGRRINSCIHRVIIKDNNNNNIIHQSHNNDNNNNFMNRRCRRLSAPFFLRPKESLSTILQQRNF